MHLLKADVNPKALRYMALTVVVVALLQLLPFTGHATNTEFRPAETTPLEIKTEQEKPFNILAGTLLADLTVQEKSQEDSVLHGPDYFDPLAERKELLREYLQKRGPRFAEYADVLAQQPHWRRITAIAFAESTLGQRCYYNNCWGIGGYPPKLRKYPTLAEGIVDANKLLSGRYATMSYQQMCGIYVQPCNQNWLKAVNQIEQEMAHIH